MLMMKVRQMRRVETYVPCPIHKIEPSEDPELNDHCVTCGTAKDETPRPYQAISYPLEKDRVLFLNPARVAYIEEASPRTNCLDPEPVAFRVVLYGDLKPIEDCRGRAEDAVVLWQMCRNHEELKVAEWEERLEGADVVKEP